MFETHISAANLPTIEAVLVVNRVHCSILIHKKIIVIYMITQKVRDGSVPY